MPFGNNTIDLDDDKIRWLIKEPLTNEMTVLLANAEPKIMTYAELSLNIITHKRRKQ